MKNKNKIVISILTVVLSLLVGCSGEQKPMKVLSVSDYSFTAKGVQAVKIYVGIDKNNYFSFNIPRSEVAKGLTGSLGGSANWSGEGYVLTSKYPTFVKYSIDEFDKTAKKATISVEIKLIDTKTQSKYFEKNTSVSITENLFDNLTKDI